MRCVLPMFTFTPYYDPSPPLLGGLAPKWQNSKYPLSDFLALNIYYLCVTKIYINFFWNKMLLGRKVMSFPYS